MSDLSERELQNNFADSTTTDNNDLFVVGIGASAGGLNALEQLFDFLPSDSGAAFVVIQHLAPDFKSLMKELLERHTEMAVYRVTQGMRLQPNSVYLIPPGQNLIVENGLLRLEARKRDKNRKHELNFPIDIFFSSLAKNYNERGIGVILSGSGSDGTQGLKAIKEVGGVALVQKPETAEFDGMPKSAIATGLVDRVLPIAELAQLIHQCVISPLEVLDTAKGTKGLLNPSTLKEIAHILIDTENLDFLHYKPSTISRRIHRRCLINNLDNIEKYIELLKTDVEERRILCSDLLIKVTRFFRDLGAWSNLEDNIIPSIIERAKPHEELRFWVTACSTGEEAYSLAILLHEALMDASKPLTIKIFATDINRTALETASSGIYPESIASNVTSERLQRYFLPKDNCYQVTRNLREMMIFSNHDLTKDAGFTRMNLVSCRNVLIYLQSDLQDKVIRNLHFALVNGGTLFLGEAETLGSFEAEFTPINRKWKQFQKRRDIRLPLPIRDNPRMNSYSVLPSKSISGKYVKESVKEQTLKRILQASEAIALAVDSNNRLLYVSGDARAIFKAPDGEITNEVVKMVVPPLQLPLNTALHRVKKEKKTVAYRSIKLDTSPSAQQVNLQVIPPASDLPQEDLFIVQISFEKTVDSPPEKAEKFESNNEANRRIIEIEQELQYTRENLQALVEELESTNEEQQASNEELTASNEELQSTNEELHSVNEELHTVNIEYQSKIQELIELNDDVDNLLKSTEIGVIFLDERLRIRKFTPAATIAVALRHSDLERPLEELSWKIDCPELMDLLQEVLTTKQPQELEVKLKQGASYFLMQIRLYQTENKHNQGLVISFIQIDEIKQAQLKLEREITTRKYTEEQLRINQEQLLITQQRVENIFSSLEDAVWSFDLPEKTLGYINSSFESIYGRTTREFDANLNLWFDVIHPEDKDMVQDAYQEIAERKKIDIEYRILHPDGSIRWLRDRSKLIYNDRNLPIRQDFVISDLTERKAAQQALKERELSFQAIFNSMFQFIGVLNPQGILLEANRTALAFGGLNPEDVIGRPFWEAKWWTISPQTQQQLKNAIARAAQGEFIRYEVDVLGAEDRVSTLDFSLKPVTDETGAVVQIIPEGREISELKAMREELKQTNLELEQRVIERTQRLADFSDRLQKIHQLAISNYDRLDDLFTAYLQAGCQIFNLTTGIVSQVNNYIYKIVAVQSPLELEVGYETSCTDTYCAEVVETESTISFSNAGKIIEMHNHPVYLNLKLESFIGTPIFVNGHLYGTLNFSNLKPKELPFTQEEIEIIELMARDIGNSIASVEAENALKQSEIRFRNTFEQAAVGVAHVSPDGTFIKVNQRLCDIVGYEDRVLVNLTFQEITHPEDLDADLEYFRQLSVGEIDNYSMEKRYIKSDTSSVWINLTASLVKDSSGKPDYFIAVIEDISDRKKTELALEENGIKLEQANRAKDNFIAHISHELRTPLTSILGFSKLLQKDYRLEKQQIDRANTIHQAGKHLLTLIDDILDFSKITANQLQIESEEFELIPFLSQIVTTLRVRAQEKNLQLQAIFSPNLPVNVCGDFNRLRQVLYNLLSNAIKFTEIGTITFKVSCLELVEVPRKKVDCRLEDASRIIKYSMRFEVRDTGIGIPQDKLADIFTPFKQLHGNTGDRKGTGLGLTISQNIMQLMGSEIKIESQIDRGSKFWFDLELSGTEKTIQCNPTELIDRELHFLQVPRKILVVDDNNDNRALLLNYLQSMNFSVAEADNGEAGIIIAETFQPELILTDLVMPIMDGKEMIARIRQHPQLKEIPIFMLSANSKLILKPSEVECNEFLPKPFDLDRLLRLLDNYLQLEWQAKITALPETEPKDFEVPPQDRLIYLLELVESGDMQVVESYIESAIASEKQYVTFAHKLQKLAANFQQNKLEKLIRKFIE